ncbi:MAG: hypothetical protein RLO17_17595 [Cyclobacteriaceae bacterium]
MKYLIDRNFRTLLLIGMGVYFIVEHLTHERPISTADLIDLNGKVSHYSFQDYTGWKKMGKQYYVYLDEYPNKFQISANYLGFFNKARFELNFKSGERIKLTIPKYQEHLIGTEDAVFLTSFSINGSQYLSKKETLEFEKESESSNSDYILGTVFIALGTLEYFFNDKIKKAINRALSLKYYHTHRPQEDN